MHRAVLKRDSTHVTLCKGMDFNESQLRTRSINLAAEATEDNQDAHSQEPSEIQTTHQASSSCFKGEILCWHEAHPIQKSVYCILLQHATKISKTAEQHTKSNCIWPELRRPRTRKKFCVARPNTMKLKLPSCAAITNTLNLHCRTIHHEHVKIALV